MVDALWTFYQKRFPEHSKVWWNDKKHLVIGFNTPRFWYVDFDNIELCGMKVKYENIFPVKPSQLLEEDDFEFAAERSEAEDYDNKFY